MTSWTIYTSILLATLWISEAVPKVGNLTCYECNRYRGGLNDGCPLKEKNLPRPTRNKCQACLKVHTRMEMHDYWNRPKVLTYESFSCAMKSTYIKAEGCYLSTGPQSFTKVCFCYTSKCNTGNIVGNGGAMAAVLVALLQLGVSALL